MMTQQNHKGVLGFYRRWALQTTALTVIYCRKTYQALEASCHLYDEARPQFHNKSWAAAPNLHSDWSEKSHAAILAYCDYQLGSQCSRMIYLRRPLVVKRMSSEQHYL